MPSVTCSPPFAFAANPSVICSGPLELLPTFTTISAPGAVFAVVEAPALPVDEEGDAAGALGKLMSIVTGLEPVSGATLITISGKGEGVEALDGAGEPLAG